ncbi:MAG: ABC transporter permease [Phycisphaerae bacterium]
MSTETLSESETQDSQPSLAGPDISPDAPVVDIRPRKGWFDIDFKELWHYRELFFFLIWRDFKARYKQSVLGASWAIIRPVMAMVVFSVVFGRFVKRPGGRRLAELLPAFVLRPDLKSGVHTLAIEKPIRLRPSAFDQTRACGWSPRTCRKAELSGPIAINTEQFFFSCRLETKMPLS